MRAYIIYMNDPSTEKALWYNSVIFIFILSWFWYEKNKLRCDYEYKGPFQFKNTVLPV